ncbi:hypothetical protein JCM21714_1627 [Gracilibacillus boraciitolerans JCM 21714]|uniref:SPOR domain-containing protein n=1 Tax=Gracilibacillus boraciitolerans JCM 21714 TaxID=1298598 RepID=W4VIN5_9BACI|nr:hypothetical protein [Gracilibacillus boraciitolerans]GAE92619.1 hypothetical protein JCM21714_1627 [Gracilibacillus boraciitolerans JCM 21714]
MENKKQVTIQLNHKSSSEEKIKDDRLEDYIREHHHPIDEGQTFKRNYTTDVNPFYPGKKQTFWMKYKSFILSALTAIFIGTFLGLMILKIFIDMDPEEVAFDANATNNQTVTTASGQTEAQNNSNTSAAGSYQTRDFTFFVTQAGVFSTKEGADQLLQNLQVKNIKGMVWHREENYHVFVGIHSTSEGSKQFAKTNFPAESEFYSGKDWQISSNEVTFSAQELAWLQALEPTLEAQVSNTTEPINQDKWLDKKPAELSELMQAMLAEIQGLDALDNEQAIQSRLLLIFYAYENLSNE